jgi:hypothetical protein
MTKMKSRPKILNCYDVLGNALTTLENNELFQLEPYLSRCGYRLAAIFRFRDEPMTIS